MKANPVTPEQALEFDGYVAKWQAKLNLHDWRLIKGSKPSKDSCAEVSIGVSDHTAVYRLGLHFGFELVNAASLESTAIHELLHILLAEFREMAESKAIPELLIAAEHRIVHTLERLLAPKI